MCRSTGCRLPGDQGRRQSVRSVTVAVRAVVPAALTLLPMSPDEEVRGEELRERELRAAAGDIAYRCSQVALIALLIGEPLTVTVPPPMAAANMGQLVSNAFVESALVHARAIAYFLGTTKKTDEVKAVDYAQYAAKVGEPLIDPDLATFVAREVLSPVSNHVAHAKYAGALKHDPDHHPDRWPIPELAVVLLDGVAQAVDRLDRTARAWFVPHPIELAGMLNSRRSYRTAPRSEHPAVLRLTDALHARLDV